MFMYMIVYLYIYTVFSRFVDVWCRTPTTDTAILNGVWRCKTSKVAMKQALHSPSRPWRKTRGLSSSEICRPRPYRPTPVMDLGKELVSLHDQHERISEGQVRKICQ